MDEKFQRIKATLEAERIKFVRLLWCDTANIIRAKAFHIDSFSRMEGSYSMDLMPASYGFTATQDTVVPATGLQPVGEVFLKPDWDTLIFPPYADAHACVMSHMFHQGKPWALDGRVCLQKMLRKLYGHYGINLQVAFKHEFYLLHDSEEGIVSADNTPYASTHALNIHQAFLNELTDALMGQGVIIHNICAEAGPGQFSVSVKHADPMVVADQQIVFRETTHAIARKHGHIASFLPKIFPHARGSSARIHLSLWENGLNVTGVDHAAGLTQTPEDFMAGVLGTDQTAGLTQTTEHFIAGILFHLPALMALLTPTQNSFRRIQSTPGVGTYAVWGRDNREAAVRVPISYGAAHPTNIEFRTPDASANPYLALAGLVAAGLEGLKEKYPLAPETTVDPAVLSKAERDEKTMMPLHADLWSALEDFRHNEVLKEAMGEELFAVYLAVKQAEFQVFKKLSLADEVELLLERY